MPIELRPYSLIKSTDLPWLGNIPEHWQIERTKWLFKSKKILNRDKRYSNVLSLTLRGVVNNNPDSPEGLVPADYGTYQFFAKGDLVFKLIDLENLKTSRVGLVHEDGIMSPAYVRLMPNHRGVQRYFYLQFYDLYQRGIYNQLGAGVRSTLGPQDLLELPIAVPPPEEQTAIVKFLDYADSRIRRHIRAKQKLVKLLEEQKQAIIQEAVTRGLNPDAPIKDSGVEWLGEIPAHWEVKRLKHVCNIDPKVRRPDLVGKTVEFLPMENVDEERGQIRNYEIRSFQEVSTGYTVFPNESVLFAKITPCMENGNCVIARDLTYEIGFGSTEFIVFKPKDASLDLSFLHYLLRSKGLRNACEVNMKGSAGQKRISSDFLKALQIGFMPIEEQREIVKFLESTMLKIERAKEATIQEIALLNEYRTRLIADVVTGKLDVRAAATSLPDESYNEDFGEDESTIDDTLEDELEASFGG